MEFRRGFPTCPPFLPAGARRGTVTVIGVVRTGNIQRHVTGVVVPGDGQGVTESGAESRPPPSPRMSHVPTLHGKSRPCSLADGIRVSGRFRPPSRRACWLEAERLIQRAGAGMPSCRIPGRQPGARRLRSRRRRKPPPERMIFRPYDGDRSSEACQLPAPGPDPCPAHRLQRPSGRYTRIPCSGSPISVRTAADVRQVLDYYDAYGAETIAEYFGRRVGHQRRRAGERVHFPRRGRASFAAFVWPGDFLDSAQCAWIQPDGTGLLQREPCFSAVGRRAGGRSLPGASHDGSRGEACELALPQVSSAGSSTPAGSRRAQPRSPRRFRPRRKAMEAIGGVARGAALLTREHVPTPGRLHHQPRELRHAPAPRADGPFLLRRGNQLRDIGNSHGGPHVLRHLMALPPVPGRRLRRCAAHEGRWALLHHALNDTTVPPAWPNGIRVVTGKAVGAHFSRNTRPP